MSARMVACVGFRSGFAPGLGAGRLRDAVSVGGTAGAAGGLWCRWDAGSACAGACGWSPGAEVLGVAGPWELELPPRVLGVEKDGAKVPGVCGVGRGSGT